jgi:hypothetical protein
MGIKKERYPEERPLRDGACGGSSGQAGASRRTQGADPTKLGHYRRGVFLDNPVQRAWRDVHAMQAHASNNLERAAAVFARSEFGLPPQDIRF